MRTQDIPNQTDVARFATLDGMRGIAALLVAIYHFGQRHGIETFSGYLAVDLFFCLSGFVIARSYGRRLSEGLPVERFLAIRVARLFPLYALGLALGLLAQLTVTAMDPGDTLSPAGLAAAVVFGATGLPDPLTQAPYPLNGASWSLFFELAVNLVFALALWRARSAVVIALVACAALALLTTVSAPHYFNLGWAWRDFVPGALRALCGFGIGMLLHRHGSVGRRSASRWALPSVAAMAMLIVFPAPPPVRALAEWVIVVLAFPLIVAAGIRWEPPAALRRPMLAAGNLSYPVYAIHMPLIVLLIPLAGPARLGIGGALAVYLVILIGAAAVAARFIDPPGRAFISRLLKDGRHQAPRATTTFPVAP